MTYQDFRGRTVRLPTERLAHIYEAHEYMVGLEWTIHQTLEAPEAVRLSTGDPGNVSLYYRRFGGPVIKGRYVCVVVKVQGDDAFILTAYITGNIKRGEPA